MGNWLRRAAFASGEEFEFDSFDLKPACARAAGRSPWNVIA